MNATELIDPRTPEGARALYAVPNTAPWADAVRERYVPFSIMDRTPQGTAYFREQDTNRTVLVVLAIVAVALLLGGR